MKVKDLADRKWIEKGASIHAHQIFFRKSIESLFIAFQARNNILAPNFSWLIALLFLHGNPHEKHREVEGFEGRFDILTLQGMSTRAEIGGQGEWEGSLNISVSRADSQDHGESFRQVSDYAAAYDLIMNFEQRISETSAERIHSRRSTRGWSCSTIEAAPLVQPDEAAAPLAGHTPSIQGTCKGLKEAQICSR